MVIRKIILGEDYEQTEKGSSLQSKHREEKEEIYLPHHSHIHNSNYYSLSTAFE